MTHKPPPRGPGILLRVTYDSIASATGLKRSTVQKHGQGKERKYDPRDLRSLARYVARMSETLPEVLTRLFTPSVVKLCNCGKRGVVEWDKPVARERLKP